MSCCPRRSLNPGPALDLNFEDGEPVLWVVVGDSFDEAGQSFGHGLRSSTASLELGPHPRRELIVLGESLEFGQNLPLRFGAVLLHRSPPKMARQSAPDRPAGNTGDGPFTSPAGTGAETTFRATLPSETCKS